MPRTAAQIQAEIDQIEAHLASSASILESVSSDGVSSRQNRGSLEKRLDRLYQQLGRANGTSPMIARSKVVGN